MRKQLIEWKAVRLIRDCLRVLGYRNNFTIAGIRYKTDPCSTGKTYVGIPTAEGAIRMIKERGLRDLKILDMGCGVGIIGLTILANFQEEGIIKEIVFADINIFNLNSLERTLRINGLDHLLGDRIRIYLSDVFKHIPREEKFDIIISNPPDWYIENLDEIELSGNTLGKYSLGQWWFHKSFYRECHEYLTERGEVWFLEVIDAIRESDILTFVGANPNLCYVKSIPDESSPRRYWSITRRA